MSNSAQPSRAATAPWIIGADSSADARIWDGRKAIPLGKPPNLGGVEGGPKILRISGGNITRRTTGETAYRRTSPTIAFASGGGSPTSARAL